MAALFQYTEVNPGDSTVLDCLVADKNPNSECIWQHDGLPVLIQVGKGTFLHKLDPEILYSLSGVKVFLTYVCLSQ